MPDVKKPLKEVLDELINGSFTILSIRKIFAAYSAMKQLPEPNVHNVSHHNSRILVGIRDRFLQNEMHPWFGRVFRWVMNMIIILYDHCGFYRYRLDILREYLIESDWEPRPPGRPKRFWKEFQKSD